MAVTVKSRKKGHLAVSGEMTIYTAGELKDKLVSPLEKGAGLEVDLSGVNEIDTAGLQLLVLVKTEAAARDKKATFVGHSQPVADIIDLCGLDGFFGDPVWI
jgi:anti-sigma B factor antagonist